MKLKKSKNKEKEKEQSIDEYKIRNVFLKESTIDINEILKKYFLLNLKLNDID